MTQDSKRAARAIRCREDVPFFGYIDIFRKEDFYCNTSIKLYVNYIIHVCINILYRSTMMLKPNQMEIMKG